jgi:branched-chain amino acid aminotransferase
MIVAIDGAIVPAERANVSVADRGFLYGDGLFEILRTWRRVAVDLDLHLDRMTAAAVQLHLAVDRVAIARMVADVIAASEGEVRIRVVVTRGIGGVAVRFADVRDGRTIVIGEPLGAPPTAISAAIVDYPLARRRLEHKTLAYLDHLIAKELAAEAGADEALRLGPDGDVVEGATSNLFVVRGGTIATPPLAGVLPGITRGHVLRTCGELGIAVSERPLMLAEVRAAEEIFVTSAVRGVVAVTRLDDVHLVVGPVTAALASAYAAGRFRRGDMAT